jgi:hypothetical protein
MNHAQVALNLFEYLSPLFNSGFVAVNKLDCYLVVSPFLQLSHAFDKFFVAAAHVATMVGQIFCVFGLVGLIDFEVIT